MSALIRTVLGEVKPSEITGALLHEHMQLAETEKDFIDARPAVIRKLTGDFKKLIKAGCNCFVDTSMNSARPRLAAELSERTGMHVVCTTGFYVEARMPRFVKKASIAEISARMERDVTEGMKGTGHRAGLIKVASNAYGVLKNERKVFLAAAKAHRKTGAPVHVHGPKGAWPQFELLNSNGVPPESISIAHIEVAPWEDILRVARAGGIMCFTNWGGKEWVPEGQIVAQVVDLVRRGFARQITISVDMYLSWTGGRLRQRWPGGYTQIFDRVIPKLRKEGLTRAQLDAIIRKNPARHLAF